MKMGQTVQFQIINSRFRDSVVNISIFNICRVISLAKKEGKFTLGSSFCRIEAEKNMRVTVMLSVNTYILIFQSCRRAGVCYGGRCERIQ